MIFEIIVGVLIAFVIIRFFPMLLLIAGTLLQLAWDFLVGFAAILLASWVLLTIANEPFDDHLAMIVMLCLIGGVCNIAHRFWRAWREESEA